MQGWLMKRGLFLCGSALLGVGAIVGLPMMLAPLVAGPVASDAPVLWAEPSDAPVLWAEPAADYSAAAASTAPMKRGAFLSGNGGRSTRTHEPAAVSTEPIMTNSHAGAVARAPEMVSDPSTQASGSPTPEPALAALNLVAAPRLEDLVVEMPQVPTLLVASELDGAPESP